MKIAVFPGSFDPVTVGHENIINRACALFDVVIVAVGKNGGKRGRFSLEQRVAWLHKVAAGNDKIRVETYDGLTADFCQRVGACAIIRGLRNSTDWQYEKDIAQTNRQLAENVETLFFATPPEMAHISSSIVYDIYANNGDYQQFMPAACREN